MLATFVEKSPGLEMRLGFISTELIRLCCRTRISLAVHKSSQHRKNWIFFLQDEKWSETSCWERPQAYLVATNSNKMNDMFFHSWPVQISIVFPSDYDFVFHITWMWEWTWRGQKCWKNEETGLELGRIYMRVQNSFMDALMMPVLHTKVMMEGRKCNVLVHLSHIGYHILPGKQNGPPSPPLPI